MHFNIQSRILLNVNNVLLHVNKWAHQLVMIRHGESEWNKLNLFTGWYDTELSDKGRIEAQKAGEDLRALGIKFDQAHTSMLKRAHCTLFAIMKITCQEKLPVSKTWRLNERHYGALTGLNKAETTQQYGEEQVKIWRRSYKTPPPPMTVDHPFYTDIVEDERYSRDIPKEKFPMAESLELTLKRTLPYWNDKIVPDLQDGKTVLIAAHGNSLRAIVKHLECMSEKEIMELNIPTGRPFMYELDKNMKPLAPMKFLKVKKSKSSSSSENK